MTQITVHGSSGNPLEITIEGKALVQATSQTQLENTSAEKGLAFSWTSTFATGAIDKEVFSLQNDFEFYHLHIDQLWLGASSAATFFWGRVSAGTPGGTPVIGESMNLDLNKKITAKATAFGNAEVTGGITVNNNAFFDVPASDTKLIDLEGAWILAKDNIFGIGCLTDTTVRVTIIGHYDLIVGDI